MKISKIAYFISTVLLYSQAMSMQPGETGHLLPAPYSSFQPFNYNSEDDDDILANTQNGWKSEFKNIRCKINDYYHNLEKLDKSILSAIETNYMAQKNNIFNKIKSSKFDKPKNILNYKILFFDNQNNLIKSIPEYQGYRTFISGSIPKGEANNYEYSYSFWMEILKRNNIKKDEDKNLNVYIKELLSKFGIIYNPYDERICTEPSALYDIKNNITNSDFKNVSHIHVEIISQLNYCGKKQYKGCYNLLDQNMYNLGIPNSISYSFRVSAEPAEQSTTPKNLLSK